MGKKRQAKQSAPAQPQAPPFNPAFAALAGLSASSPETHADRTVASSCGGCPPQLGQPSAEGVGASDAPPSVGADAVRLSGKWLVRFERKGHGGKSVTVVEALGPKQAMPPTAARLALARSLAKSLGCRGQVQADTIVLSGDLRVRLPPLLEARGAQQVVVS